MFIYEAGTLTYYFKKNKFHNSTIWREKLDNWANDADCDTFNPAKNFVIEKNHTYSDKLVVDQNDYYINNSDICVVCIDDIDQSPGTIYELTRFKEQRKPVIAFGSQGKHWSPHINSCISEYCDTIEDVIDLLMNMFDQ